MQSVATPADRHPKDAAATIINKSGEEIGLAKQVQGPIGVLVRFEVTGHEPQRSGHTATIRKSTGTHAIAICLQVEDKR